MVRSELVQEVADKMNLHKKEAEMVVNTFLDSISDALGNGQRVEIRGFGTFNLRQRQARVGRNPKTGESVAISAKTVMHFMPGKMLKKQVDS